MEPIKLTDGELNLYRDLELEKDAAACINELIMKRNLSVADGIIKAEPSALELINDKIQEAERQILLCSIATVISSLITVACVVYFW